MLYLCYRQETRTGDEMSKLELLALLYSLRELMDSGNNDRAMKVIEKVIAEAEKT